LKAIITFGKNIYKQLFIEGIENNYKKKGKEHNSLKGRGTEGKENKGGGGMKMKCLMYEG